MHKKFVEETVLFISIIKWAVLAILTGIIVGLSTTVFLKALGWSIVWMQTKPNYFLLLPVAFFLSSLLIRYLAPDAEGHGTEKVIEAVHKRWGKIPMAVVPIKLVATIITIAGGGSAGKEGPSAQIGAAMASGLADLLRLTKEDRRKLVVCGISAGFAAVFGTPIAGALFAVEVLVLGRVFQEMLFPSLVAAIISFQIARFFGLTYFHQSIQLTGFSRTLFLEVLLSGLYFGLVALLLVETLREADRLSKALKLWKPLKGIIGGAVLVILALFCSTRYLGLGIESISAALDGKAVPGLAFIWKTLFTSITLSMGGSGGILTPVFFIGTTAGSTFARLFHLSPSLFAAIGMVALLAGAANTPIAASVMAIEIFGPQVGSYAAIVCVVSYIASGHRSVYASQVLGVTKSASISAPLMKELESIDEVEVKDKPGKVIHSIKRILLLTKLRKKYNLKNNR
ncbi:MAG: chloride channel protein [Bacteroidota bacterium]